MATISLTTRPLPSLPETLSSLGEITTAAGPATAVDTVVSTRFANVEVEGRIPAEDAVVEVDCCDVVAAGGRVVVVSSVVVDAVVVGRAVVRVVDTAEEDVVLAEEDEDGVVDVVEDVEDVVVVLVVVVVSPAATKGKELASGRAPAAEAPTDKTARQTTNEITDQRRAWTNRFNRSSGRASKWADKADAQRPA